jgi:hypothetical protein
LAGAGDASVMRALWLVLLALLACPSGITRADDSSPAEDAPPWSRTFPDLAPALRRGAPLVIHVLVPLCDKRLIACGGSGLGSPSNPKTNLYWGAIFGAPRFFERKAAGYESLPQPAIDGVLERRAYRRRVDGARWGQRADVEVVVVLDAIDGTRIDDAVSRFYESAGKGGQLSLVDGQRKRKLAVSVMGYAGHNRLMDGVVLPAPATPSDAAVPSFVMACDSDGYFSEPLRRAGSTPLVMTQALMAPEGYVVEAMARGLADNLSRPALRERVVQAYAKWQKLSPGRASAIFAR